MNIQNSHTVDSLNFNSEQLLKLTFIPGYELKKININSKLTSILEKGVDLFYIDKENNLLLSSLLRSSLMSMLNADKLINSISEDKIQNLSPYWKNKICHDLYYSPFLEDLMKKGLTIEQQEFYQYMPSELYSLKMGEDNFLKNFVYNNPNFNFEHVYTFKEENIDCVTTLRQECQKILEVNALSPEGNVSLPKQTKIVNKLNTYFFYYYL